MRVLLLLVGIVLMAAALLWFLTPVLDGVWERGVASVSTGAAGGAASRSAAPATAGAQASRKAAPAKLSFENLASVIHVATGLVGAWFAFLSYRLKRRAYQMRLRE